ncbi:MAG: hypothetical protein GY866_42095 [Proteobacteria bacterium]|nr:hypothetical protein [Pseudomonadota bacterium]
MTENDILNQIPEDWLERIDRSDIHDVTRDVTNELLVLAGRRLKLDNPSLDEVASVGTKVWHMTSNEVRNTLKSIIDLRATTRLFVGRYGHLFPRDEKGNPILRPAEIARIHGRSEEEIIELIFENKEDLIAKGLLHDITEPESDSIN